MRSSGAIRVIRQAAPGLVPLLLWACSSVSLVEPPRPVSAAVVSLEAEVTDVPSLEGVLDGVVGPTLHLVPRGSAPVGVCRARRRFLEAPCQELTQQPVVAEPTPLAVERDDELVAARQPVEPVCGPGPPGDRVGKRAAHRVDDGRPDEHVVGLRIHSDQHLGLEVRADDIVIACDHCRPVRLVAGLHQEAGQADPGRPTLRAGMDVPDDLIGWLQAQTLEDAGALRYVEREVCEAHLSQQSAEPPAGNRQIHRLACRQSDPPCGRYLVGEQCQDIERPRIGELVDVVDDEEDRAAVECGRLAES